MNKLFDNASEAVNDMVRVPRCRWVGSAVRVPSVSIEALPQSGTTDLAAEGGLPWRHEASGNVTVSSPPKETRKVDGRDYVLEEAIIADFGLVAEVRHGPPAWGRPGGASSGARPVPRARCPSSRIHTRGSDERHRIAAAQPRVADPLPTTAALHSSQPLRTKAGSAK